MECYRAEKQKRRNKTEREMVVVLLLLLSLLLVLLLWHRDRKRTCCPRDRRTGRTKSDPWSRSRKTLSKAGGAGRIPWPSCWIFYESVL